VLARKTSDSASSPRDRVYAIRPGGTAAAVGVGTVVGAGVARAGVARAGEADDKATSTVGDGAAAVSQPNAAYPITTRDARRRKDILPLRDSMTPRSWSVRRIGASGVT
jgi:hypothetical protein